MLGTNGLEGSGDDGNAKKIAATVYYDSNLGQNAYLNNGVYQLGAGSLIPYPFAPVVVPEPSSLALVALAVPACLALRSRRKTRA